jgi:RNA polymerase sigma-70 factor, ECF subfamily
VTAGQRKSREEPTDEELALAFQKGDEIAFDMLVRRHQGRVYAVAFRVTNNREDARDVAQDVFVKAYSNPLKWKPTGKFLPWLLRLTLNQAIDLLRRKKRHREETLDASGSERMIQAPAAETDRRAQADEINLRIQKALESLSPAQRAVFILRHYEGLPLADSAKELGCSAGSVKVHLFRALKKLRAGLNDLYDSL